MGNRIVLYKININGIEKIGTVKELYEMSGFTMEYFRQIANGDARCPEGMRIQRLDELSSVVSDDIRKHRLLLDWDEIVEPFRKVQWIPKGRGRGKRLVVRR